MKMIALGAVALTAVACIPMSAYANPQDDAAAAFMFGTMMGVMMNATRPPPPPVVYVVPQPYPVYQPFCWNEQRWVPGYFGPELQIVRVCQ